MKRLLLDTNIILDIALKREPHFEFSSKIFELIDKKRIIGYITASTVTDIYCRSGGNRTLDPMIKSHVLCQLSYGPDSTAKIRIK